jgi:hypothetical protein
MKASRPNDAEDTRGEVTTPDADFGSDGALGKKVQELASRVADEHLSETAEEPPCSTKASGGRPGAGKRAEACRHT